MTTQTTLFDIGALERPESVCANPKSCELTTPVLRLPGGPQGHSSASWRAWTADTDADHAAAAFLRRYGVHPEFVVDGLGGLLLVGPIPAMEV